MSVKVTCVNECLPTAPVGLVSPPCACGPSAGDFGDADDWTVSGGASIEDGQLKMDGTGGGLAVTQAPAPITAGTYHYEFDLIATDGVAPVRVIVGNSSFTVTASTVPGHYEGTMTSTGGNSDIGLACASGVITVDNFRVWKVA